MDCVLHSSSFGIYWHLVARLRIATNWIHLASPSLKSVLGSSVLGCGKNMDAPHGGLAQGSFISETLTFTSPPSNSHVPVQTPFRCSVTVCLCAQMFKTLHNLSSKSLVIFSPVFMSRLNFWLKPLKVALRWFSICNQKYMDEMNDRQLRPYPYIKLSVMFKHQNVKV